MAKHRGEDKPTWFSTHAGVMAALPEVEVAEGSETDLGNSTSGCCLRWTPSLLSCLSPNPSPEHTRQHQTPFTEGQRIPEWFVLEGP